MTKFREGIENLMTGQFEVFMKNETFRKRLPEIQAYLKRTDIRIRVVLVYSGINPVSEDRL